MGKYKLKVWYQSPYPDDAARLPQMYICEFCLHYQKSVTGIKRQAQKCVWRHPSGDEIYRKGKEQVWQVDGKRHKQYCQHLCLLAKFFLDHNTLYYDVILFCIMTLDDFDGCHTVGYFRKVHSLDGADCAILYNTGSLIFLVPWIDCRLPQIIPALHSAYCRQKPLPTITRITINNNCMSKSKFISKELKLECHTLISWRNDNHVAPAVGELLQQNKKL